MRNPKTQLAIIFLVAVSLVSIKALFHPGFFTSHDGWNHVARLYHFNQAVNDGQLVPRWSGNLLNGFGYPLFFFSYHLPWYMAMVFLRLGLSIFDAIKGVFIVTYVVSGLTMYLFGTAMWGRLPALVVSILYLFTPYRLAVIFVRGNVGEATAFMFIPLVFWATFELSRRYRFSRIFVGALAVFGLLLSHAMVSLLFLIPLFLFTAACAFQTRNKGTFLASFGSLVCLGTLLSAYYLLPAAVYKSLTVFKEMYHTLYVNYFTPLRTLFYSPWGYSPLGHPGEMSRGVGLVLWLVGGLGLSFLLIVFGRHSKQKKRDVVWGSVLVASFLFAVFMMLEVSAPVWRIIEPLALVDFPWRFLAVTTFIGSTLSGYVLSQVKSLRGVVAVGLILAALYTNRNHLRVNQYTDIPLSLYIASELTTSMDHEYLPKDIDYNQAKNSRERVSGNARISDIQQKSNEISFTSESPVGTEAQIHHGYFPGWLATIDGRQVELRPSDRGEMLIKLPFGVHRGVLRYSGTPLIKMSEAISLGTLVYIFLKLLRERARGKN